MGSGSAVEGESGKWEPEFYCDRALAWLRKRQATQQQQQQQQQQQMQKPFLLVVSWSKCGSYLPPLIQSAHR
jgi:hypothetical protein